ncbi:MAG: hypothetical protein ABUL61_00380, partial [Oleiharenicola lentus]
MPSRSKLTLASRGLCATALVLWAGCKTSTYVLQVDAISQTGAVAQQTKEPHSYLVRSRNPQTAEDTLRYKEVSQYIKTALSGKGLYEAASAESADLIIEIDYGMETPRMKYETVSTPIMGMQAGPNTLQNILVKTSNGSLVYKQVGIPGAPVRRVVGWKEETEPVVVYEKYLKVSARANSEAVEGQPAPEVWSVNASAEDQSNALRKYMPIL